MNMRGAGVLLPVLALGSLTLGRCAAQPQFRGEHARPESGISDPDRTRRDEAGVLHHAPVLFRPAEPFDVQDSRGPRTSR